MLQNALKSDDVIQFRTEYLHKMQHEKKKITKTVVERGKSGNIFKVIT